LLHAAAFGYAQSHNAFNFEASVTSGMEAIERLVSVIEAGAGLQREMVPPKDWKPVGRDLKRVVGASGLPADTIGRLKRSYAPSPTLTLEERIRRVAKTQQKQWSKHDLTLLDGLGELITARNDIVHGRLVKDLQHLYTQRIRAQALFEQIFLTFLGCRRVRR